MGNKPVRMVRVQMDASKWAEIRQYGIRKRKNMHTLVGQMLEREIDRLLAEEVKAGTSGAVR